MLLRLNPRTVFIPVFLVGLSALTYLLYSVSPVSSSAIPTPFEVRQGEGFRAIVERLHEQKLIRSKTAFKAVAFFWGKASEFKPGEYELAASSSSLDIVLALTAGSRREVTVVIYEGATMFDIDRILAASEIIPAGALIGYKSDELLEGRLFPDTYRFFVSSTTEEVVGKFLKNFETKAAPLLNRDKKNFEENLILASLLETEVPEHEEQRIVAGIIKKRLAADMPFQIDSTICYIKEQRKPGTPCLPVTALDLKIDSGYNTYLYRGWPAGPVGNPGIRAIEAALSPKSSPYWFYLSDPKTQKTIFAQTLDEHTRNRVKYLGLK